MGEVSGHPMVEQPKALATRLFEYKRVYCLVLIPTRDEEGNEFPGIAPAHYGGPYLDRYEDMTNQVHTGWILAL